MLTPAIVKAARPRAAAYKLTDGAGLHLFVAPGGLKSWRLRFRWQGREQLLTIGSWPEVDIGEARTHAAEARDAIAQGIDPRGRARAGAITFEAAARAWHAHMAPRWSARHAADVIDSLERDVFPRLGTRSLGSIEPPDILTLLRSIEARGALETARRVRQRVSGVYALAISEGRASSDPAAIVGRALVPPPPQVHLPALTDLDEVRALIAAVEALDAPAIVKLASRLLALTAVRHGTLRMARWDEFEDLDGREPLWRVPAAHMKLKRARKADAANDHLVPLSRCAIETLVEARRAAFHESGPVFNVAGGALPEAAIGALYAAAGFAGRHVPHGWRSSFSTILNETFPADRAAIDRALAHAPKDKVEAAYNRAQQLGRRRELFEAWAAMIT